MIKKEKARQEPNDPRTLALGESQLEMGLNTFAAGAARKILKRDPNHLGALELLAKAQWRGGEFESSLDTLRHLIRLNPYEPGYHYMKAMALQSLGRYGEAVRSFGRCLTSDSESLAGSAAASIRELEQWQEGVIAELLHSDSRFRTEYAIDPMGACRQRGFAFAAEDVAVSTRLAATAPMAAVAWDRPS
jgi:tetratricopeptide (TPR) repeat protein